MLNYGLHTNISVTFIPLKNAVVFFFTLIMLLSNTALAQISYTPESMGLGGGGTAYVTDYEALFINPANIHLRERTYRVQISALESGAYLDSPLRIRNGHDRIQLFEQTMNFAENSEFTFTGDQRDKLISRYFNNDRPDRQLQSSSVINWLGIKWFGEEKSYGLALRTRQSSRYVIGRGFYDSDPIETGNGDLINHSLSHQYQTLHELSFGYSESLSFLSGLVPQISTFIIGIAPKIVVAGSGFSTDYTNRFTRNSAGSPWQNERSYRFSSSGEFSSYAETLAGGADPFAGANSTISLRDLMNPSGIGGAIDLGITYLFTFGDDLSLLRRGEEATEKSLRLSFSITDLGLIHYFEDPYRTETNFEVDDVPEPGPVSDQYFVGSLLQDFSFLSEQQNGRHPLSFAENPDRSGYQELLPTAVQTGVLFQINRVKMMGDFRLGLTDNAFHTTKLTSYIGTEIRPLPFLPIRAGTRLATDLPGYYSFGAGIETGYFDIDAAVQFRSTSAGPTLEPVAASAVAVKFYIP